MTLIETVIAPELFDLPPHKITSGTVYHDAWCSPYVCIHFPTLRGLVRIGIEFWNPAMMDQNPNEVVVRANHRAIAVFPDLAPEQIESLEADVDASEQNGVFLSVRSAGHCPQSPDDIRPLALVLRRLSVRAIAD